MLEKDGKDQLDRSCEKWRSVTSISPFIFPSITCFRRKFQRKMWPIQLAIRFLISCRIFLCSLNLSNTSSFLTWSVQLIFSILLQHHISKLSRYFLSAARIVQVYLNNIKKKPSTSEYIDIPSMSSLLILAGQVWLGKLTWEIDMFSRNIVKDVSFLCAIWMIILQVS